MKALLILSLGLLLTPSAWSLVTIRCDFTDPAMMGKPMEYHWDIYNRISPMRNSWGPDFVAYCMAHKLPYDFVGMSFYPFYNRMDRVDLENVYAKDIAPIKDRPDWNPKASFEIHEYALIVTMGGKGSS